MAKKPTSFTITKDKHTFTLRVGDKVFASPGIEGDNEMTCGRCGEPTENPYLCGDCDVTYATLSSTCRECGFFICDPELISIPREKQHSNDCSLAKSESYGPRNVAELRALDKGMTR